MDWNYLFTSMEGRISRQPFWIGHAILTVTSWLANLIISGIFGNGMIGGLLSLIMALLLLYPLIALAAKRWHDRDKSGWWNLTLLIPLFGWLWYSVECGFLAGTPGPNRFGRDPLGNAIPVYPALKTVLPRQNGDGRRAVLSCYKSWFRTSGVLDLEAYGKHILAAHAFFFGFSFLAVGLFWLVLGPLIALHAPAWTGWLPILIAFPFMVLAGGSWVGILITSTTRFVRHLMQH
jgi:uncharacterized membrane protein YhaH (DUF805 family)